MLLDDLHQTQGHTGDAGYSGQNRDRWKRREAGSRPDTQEVWHPRRPDQKQVKDSAHYQAADLPVEVI